MAPIFEFEDSENLDKELGVWKTQGRTVVGSIKHGKHINLSEISFDRLVSISLGAAFNKEYEYKGSVELRRGQVNGDLLGSRDINYFNKSKEGFKTFEIDLEPSSGLDALFLVFKNNENEDQYIMNADWVQLNYDD